MAVSFRRVTKPKSLRHFGNWEDILRKKIKPLSFITKNNKSNPPTVPLTTEALQTPEVPFENVEEVPPWVEMVLSKRNPLFGGEECWRIHAFG